MCLTVCLTSKHIYDVSSQDDCEKLTVHIHLLLRSEILKRLKMTKTTLDSQTVAGSSPVVVVCALCDLPPQPRDHSPEPQPSHTFERKHTFPLVPL